MDKGDRVIADHPESDSSTLTRSYGIVLKVSKSGKVLIRLADGTVIKRHGSSVAVYVQPPNNWQDLFDKQEVIFSHPKHSIPTSRQKTPPQRDQ